MLYFKLHATILPGRKKQVQWLLANAARFHSANYQQNGLSACTGKPVKQLSLKVNRVRVPNKTKGWRVKALAGREACEQRGIHFYEGADETGDSTFGRHKLATSIWPAGRG